MHHLCNDKNISRIHFGTLSFHTMAWQKDCSEADTVGQTCLHHSESVSRTAELVASIDLFTENLKQTPNFVSPIAAQDYAQRTDESRSCRAGRQPTRYALCLGA